MFYHVKIIGKLIDGQNIISFPKHIKIELIQIGLKSRFNLLIKNIFIF